VQSMKHHLAIWLVTAAVLLSAASIAVVRQTGAFRERRTPPLEDLVDQALALLEADPAAWERETQSLVRAVATHVENGEIRSAAGYHILALQYRREDNISSAEALYKRAIAQEPDWSWPYAGLGTLLGRHCFGRAEEAIEALRKAIALDPAWGRPYNGLAVVLRIQGRLDEAEQAALEALRLEPDDIASHNNYANLLVAQERFEDAERHYHIASKLNPDHPKPYYNLACLHSLLGRKAEALRFLQQALKRSANLRGEAAVDPDLTLLHDEPEFRQLVYGVSPPTGVL